MTTSPMMMVLPHPAQVSGSRLMNLYEAYYSQLDPSGKGVISAGDGAKFLKRSGLSDAILSKIWDLSDPNGKGFLDKAGLFVSLKLITLAQNGKDVNMSSILSDIQEEPQMGERPVMTSSALSTSEGDWMNISLEDVEKLARVFDSLEHIEGGKIAGNKAKGTMMESKLSVDVLGKVWDLADTDKDGALDLTEFTIAMYLLSCVSCKRLVGIPSVLPSEFHGNVKRLVGVVNTKKMPVGGVPTVLAQLPVAPPIPPPISAPVQVSVPPKPPTPIHTTNGAFDVGSQDNWIVPPEDRLKYSQLFNLTDKDRDGFVSGVEIKEVFLGSGLAQSMLAHIWNLCDTEQSGKLTSEQFTLAMWFIQRKLGSGIDPPNQLSRDMVPPSLRTAISPPPTTTNNTQNETISALNPEFELIMKEIQQLSNEKSILENEIYSKETEKKIKSGEMKSLQSELDTLAATLRQLENQKNVAVSKLGELQAQVMTLRGQAEEQETTLITQELENSSKSVEVENMNKDELSLFGSIKSVQSEIESLEEKLQLTQLEISKTRTRITDLLELENSIKCSVIKYDTAIESGNVYVITEPELRDLKTDFEELCQVVMEIVGSHSFVQANHSDNDFQGNQHSIKSPFSDEDDDFGKVFTANSHIVQKNSGFNDPFAPLPTVTPQSQSQAFGFESDPFGGGSSDRAWSSGGGDASGDVFGAVEPSSLNSKDYSPGKDPFGHEPFAALSVSGGAPALPPKNQQQQVINKKPPPRPAPPKNVPARPPPPSFSRPPSVAAKQDPFVDLQPAQDPFNENLISAPTNDPFAPSATPAFVADFANFDTQFTSPKRGSSSPWGGTSPSTMPVKNSAKSRAADRKKKSSSQLDFTEDPFKNYRYEDPFALSIDPFQQQPSNQDPFTTFDNKQFINNNT